MTSSQMAIPKTMIPYNQSQPSDEADTIWRKDKIADKFS